MIEQVINILKNDVVIAQAVIESARNRYTVKIDYRYHTNDKRNYGFGETFESLSQATTRAMAHLDMVFAGCVADSQFRL